MGLLDPQGPSRGSAPAPEVGRGIELVARDPRSRGRFHRLGRGWLILAMGVPVTGCETSPPPTPAAASNEVYDHKAGTLDDRWASIVLDESQRAEVRGILRDAVVGPVFPMAPARHGVRFEDSPQAMIIAAPSVEMAILESHHDPEKASVTYLDSRGRRAVATIRLRERGPIASVEYRVPGTDAARERSNQLIDLEDRMQVATTEAGPTISGRSAEAIIRASVRSRGGRVLSSGTEPEQYRFVLLMLDEEQATLTVLREPEPRILSIRAEAGLFENDLRTKELEAAFRRSLEAWGRVPAPEMPASGIVKNPGPDRASVGEE